MLLANPIYDTVFKHLLEDMEVARQLLGLILDLEVVELVAHAQEVTSTPVLRLVEGERERMLRVFRMDFVATIRTREGKAQRVIIELQKAVAPDFVGRFRRYLGRQYQEAVEKKEGENLTREDHIAGKGHLPVIGVYLFGFPLSETHPKVVRIQRQYLHYSTYEVLEGGIPAMELLTHDAVMVQLSKVGEPGNGEIDEVLRLFDQSRCMEDVHFVEYEPTDQVQSPLLKRMVRILQRVATDAETQRGMEAEDEVEQHIAEMEKIKEASRKAEAERDEERQQKEEERRQKEEERRQKEEERRQKEAVQAKLEEMRELMRKAGLDPDKI